jgi:hypothetical protein
MKAPMIFSGVAALVVAGAVIAGFSLLGTPGEVRLRRLDQQKVGNLQLISNAIETYRNANKVLPESLAKLQQSKQWPYLILKDPVFGEPYEYKVRDDVTYDLCADFSTEAGDDVTAVASGNFVPPFWSHARGRRCYTFHVRPN